MKVLACDEGCAVPAAGPALRIAIERRPESSPSGELKRRCLLDAPRVRMARVAEFNWNSAQAIHRIAASFRALAPKPRRVGRVSRPAPTAARHWLRAENELSQPCNGRGRPSRPATSPDINPGQAKARESLACELFPRSPGMISAPGLSNPIGSSAGDVAIRFKRNGGLAAARPEKKD